MSTGTFNKGPMAEIGEDDQLNVERGEQLFNPQETFGSDEKLTMSSSNLSFSNIPEDGQHLFFLCVKRRSAASCEGLEGTMERTQMPEFGPSENLEVTPLLETLRSEPKVIDSGLIYSKAMKRLNTIKEDGTLDR